LFIPAFVEASAAKKPKSPTLNVFAVVFYGAESSINAIDVAHINS